MDEYDGIIDQWYMWQVTKKEFVICGTCLEDKKGRGFQGYWMHTSGIKNRACKEGDIVQTRNSRYLLGKRNESNNTRHGDNEQ